MVDKIFNNLSAMVVDDELIARNHVARMLEKIGLGEIVTADNGAEALEKLEARKEDLDVIVCDIEMPEMDGYELIRRIRYGVVPRFKDVPIVVLTGVDSEKNVRHARILKIDGFVVKPANAELFEKRIRRILTQRIRQALGIEGKAE